MEVEERVLIAKLNNNELNSLLSEYKPFIRKIVSETCNNRYVEWGRDEELSIGLLAFEEAINRYDKDKGNFLSLARTTIKSRVIDYLRKENKYSYLDIDKYINYLPIKDSNPAIDEINELESYIKEFKITFQDLPNISPKKRKLREELKYTAQITAKNISLVNIILEKKQLPIIEIANLSGISNKKIERNRIYLITLILICYLDLPILQSYIK